MGQFLYSILVLVCFSAVSPGQNGLGATEESILDRVSSSPEFRQKLLKEYESNPGDFRDDRLLAIGIGYIEDDRFDKAQPVYERFLRHHPSHARALRGLGTAHYYQKHFDEAIKCYRQAWALGDLDSLGALAGTYVNRKRYSEMEDLLLPLQQHMGEDPVIVNCLVAYAIYHKDPPDAKLVLKALAALSDQDILQREDTSQLIGEVVSRFGRSPELEMAQLPVLVKIVRGYEADPQKWPPSRRLYVADSYCLVNQHVKAEPIYREILNDDPHSIGALRGLGISLTYQRKFKEALVPLRKAWDRGDQLSLSAMAACYLSSRDFDGMKDLIPSLLELRKEDMESLNIVIMYAVGKPSSDRELFFKAIEGFTDEQLLRNEEVTHNTILGLKLFGDKKRAEHLQKLRSEQHRGKKA